MKNYQNFNHLIVVIKQKHCIQAFINPKTKQFIHKDEIDVLFSLLIDQDYTIQYEMTKMFNNNNNNNNPNLICFISKMI